MRFLTATALAALAASPAEAQSRFFGMPSRVELFAHAALDTERQEAADLAAVAAEIATRNACANAGRIYLPTHASADAGGCVNPAIWAEAWSVGAWGGCSVTCGGGSQSRAVQCFDGLGTPQPDAACPAPKPATTQACNTQACAAQPCSIAWASNANHGGQVPEGTILWCRQSPVYNWFGGWQVQQCFWQLPTGGGSAFYNMWAFRNYLNGATRNGWNYKGVQNQPTYGALNQYKCRQ